ncbi:MAG: Rrf2 family transcriptional regulator [Nitrospinae bacterium]|nr:Rrf2 family transcriptional regulator [Nitrospinota bacterium]
MWVSAKGDYALRAMSHLAVRYEQGYVQVGEIAKAQRIPTKFLEQILLRLKKGGYLTSKRGAQGGYMLTRSPAEITVGEVMRLMEGPLQPMDCVGHKTVGPCFLIPACGIKSMWEEVAEATARILERTTIADLCQHARTRGARLFSMTAESQTVGEKAYV